MVEKLSAIVLLSNLAQVRTEIAAFTIDPVTLRALRAAFLKEYSFAIGGITFE